MNGVGVRSPYTRWSKTAGGAVLGRQDALGGWLVASRSTAGRDGGPHPRPLSTMVGRGGFLLSRDCAYLVARRYTVRVWAVSWRAWHVGQGAGIGRDAGQALLAQPARAGRRGYGGGRCGTQTVMTRRPRRYGEGSAMTRCPRGRHSDSTDPAPRPWWPGVRQHPVPLWRHSDGHAAPRALRRGVAHDPVPGLAGWRTPPSLVRHDDTSCTSLPGGARCSRKVLHLPIPRQW